MRFEKVIDDIYILKTPFQNVWTGIILINGNKKILIDSGADEPQKYIIPQLAEMGISINDIDYLLATHSHGDHVSGHFTLVNEFGLKTAVIKEGRDNLENPLKNAIRIRAKFPDNSPKAKSDLKGVLADIILEDGDVLEDRLKVIHTPGHDSDSVCWYDLKTKTLITGDSLQGNGTISQGVGFYQSLCDYRDTLKVLSKLDAENIVCGHDYDGIGSVIIGKENVKKTLEYCFDIICEYDRIIKKHYSCGCYDIAELAENLIKEAGCGMPDNLFLAMYTASEHIRGIQK